MKIRTLLLLCLSALCLSAHALSDGELNKLRARVRVYINKVDSQPDWLTSRLQMYWATHATDVYVNGESFDHAGGQRAPFATVKFDGTRGTRSYYNRPRLEDVVPYDDDEEGNVTYVNPSTGQMEKAHPSKVGRNIDGLNKQILGIARDASAVYAATGEEPYARLAAGVMDTYLKGIYYRNRPQDINHGHIETILGMASFEVIHEDCINSLVAILANLGSYVQPGDRQLYHAALKKWAEVIIEGGVPHNNWDLFQAIFIARIALVLDADSHYADHKGREYYLDYILHQNSVRQWSIAKLCSYGFDADTHIWYESPGYSLTVLRDFADFIALMYDEAGIDLIEQIPTLVDAELAQPQYMTPNRMFCGFGDSHPSYMNTAAIATLARYARAKGDDALALRFDSLALALSPKADKALVERYVSASFYAPNVSWLVQRTGMDARHDLMVSLNGSLGNHMHANGISMELYGKGYVLGPDAGIGKYLYNGDDYKEYYSQFPAHNTVCVDGVSSYGVMMSQHAFKLEGRYPDTNAKGTFYPATYSQVSFVEPETQADQLRTNGIVRTSERGGYYIDIFRSRRKDGRDKMHDYFYHNLGQRMTLAAADGSPLGLAPTKDLAFAGGHLYAYSYIYDALGATMTDNVKATFTTDCADGRRIDMTLWMRKDDNRMVVKALSPVNMQYERMPDQPYRIIDQPVLTFVARQQGEAWNHPFVAVFEPSDSEEPSEIAGVGYFSPSKSDSSCVGIIVRLKSGRTDYIFSSPQPGTEMRHGRMKTKARYAVFCEEKGKTTKLLEAD